MKHTRLLSLLMAVATMPLMFTSCDDPWDYYDYYDDWYDGYDWYNDAFNHGTSQLNLMAQTLRGHWEGTMRNEYTNEYGEREYVDMNVYFEFDQYNSLSLNGRGREVDYVGNESQELRFSWYIDPRTGDIRIKYDGSNYTFLLDSHANTPTSGFSLSDDFFSGVMEGLNNTELIYFDCERTTLAKPNPQWRHETKDAKAKGKYSEKMKFRKRP